LPLFKTPLKELPAGEGITLFGGVATPHLAGFHNTLFTRSFQVSILASRMPHMEKIAMWAFVNLKRIISFFMDS
jgi:hypothetical protein